MHQIKKHSLALVLSVACCFSAKSQVRTWTDGDGRTIQAELISIEGNGEIIIERHPEKLRFRISPDRFSEEDKQYIQRFRDTKPMRDAGYLEFTERLIKNFPEKVDQRQGWFDGRFLEVSSSMLEIYLSDSVYISLGFRAQDSNGDTFNKFIARKKEFSDTLLALKKGQKIRVVGKVAGMGTSEHWILVDKIIIIKEKVENAPNQ